MAFVLVALGAGVAVSVELLEALAIVRPLAPALWHGAGGFLLLAGVLAVLLAATRPG